MAVVGGRRGGAHQDRVGFEVIDARRRRGVPDPGHLRLLQRRADPAKIRQIEFDVAAVGRKQLQPRLERHVAGRHADHGAVALGDIVEIIGDDQPGGARHVLDDDGGIAGDVPAVVIGQRAGGDVVAAGRRAGDRKLDGLAAIKVCDGFARAPLSATAARSKTSANAEMSCARHAAASASEASSRPWPLIGSLMPSALKAAKKLAWE